jgi:uncharacterized BrkB/YihY/UPF0761 family membrane protein
MKTEIKRKIWKYFLQQKAKEIWEGVSFIFLLTFALLVVFGIMGLLFHIGYYLLKFIPEYTQNIMSLIGIIAIGLFMLFVFGWGIYDWLKSNWEKAKRRALKECQ